MQIGQDRSGFYSYTFLEDVFGCEMPDVHRLVADWKPRAQGETVWFCTPRRFKGQGKMISAIVEPDRAFAMVSTNDWRSLRAGGNVQEGFWSFTLEPSQNGQTRLIARLRGGKAPSVTAQLLGRLFWEPAHFVMEQKCCAPFATWLKSLKLYFPLGYTLLVAQAKSEREQRILRVVRQIGFLPLDRFA